MLEPGLALPSLAGPYCGCGGEAVVPGVGIERVVAGVYGMRLDGPVRVKRAAAATEEEFAPRTEITLGPGDVAVYLDYAAGGKVRNVGRDQLVVLGIAIVAAEAPEEAPITEVRNGATVQQLSRAFWTDWAELPSGPKTVTLQRMTIAPGTDLPPYEPGGMEAIYVESGELSAATIPPGATEPNSRPLSFAKGRTMPFLPLRPGTQRVLSNPGQEPAVILILLIAPAAASAGTPSA